MSSAQCAQAIDHGCRWVQDLPGNAVLSGEMGIGNILAARLLMARLSGQPLADCIGRGTGLGNAGLARKHAVLARAGAARVPLNAQAVLDASASDRARATPSNSSHRSMRRLDREAPRLLVPGVRWAIFSLQQSTVCCRWPCQCH